MKWNELGLISRGVLTIGTTLSVFVAAGIIASQGTTGGGGGTTTTTTVPSGTCPAGWPSRSGVVWPCAGTTGVPSAVLAAAGVGSPQSLPVYTGPTNITTCGRTQSTGAAATGIVNGVIDGVYIPTGIDVNAGNGLSDGSAASACVTIKNSYVNGAVEIRFPGGACTAAPANGICGPILITDSEIAPPDCPTGSCAESFAIRGPNIHAYRVNVHNSTHPAFYEDLAYDEMHDSYAHGIYANGGTHTAAVAVNTASTGAFNTFDHNYMSSDRAGGSWTSGGGFSDVFNIYIQRSNAHDNTVTNNYFTGNIADAGGVCTISDMATTYVDGSGSHGTVYPGSSGTFDAWNENWANNVYDFPNCGNVIYTLVDQGYMAATGVRTAITNGYRANWNQAADPNLPHNDKWCNNKTVAGAQVGPNVC